MMYTRLYVLILASLFLGTTIQSKPKKVVEEEISVSEWAIAEARAENAVVQLWVQGTEFNWMDPYKSPDHRAGAGSGFFIDKEGHLLTNYHVVAGARSVFITIPGVGRHPLEVSIVGVCPDLDVALLKLTPQSYTIAVEACGGINALEFGNSDVLYNNEHVLALGFPLGFHTRKGTTGTVGGRDFINGQPLVHITAAINPGNSGGPLLNKVGKVVGINTGGWAETEGYNYIVPINDVLIILSDLYKTKLVRRPEIAIGANHTTEAHAQSLHNPIPAGLYVHYVTKNSVEEKAGIAVGDMIYEIAVNNVAYKVDEFGEVSVPWRKGEKISTAELLSRCRIGDPITVVLYRSGERKVLHFTYSTSQLPSVRRVIIEYEPEEADYEIIGGLVIMQLRLNHVMAFEKSPNMGGLKEFRDCARPTNRSNPALVITTVFGGSQADLSQSLTAGFILDTVNGKKVTSLKELRDALLLSAQTKEIAIQTKDKYATVLDLRKVLQEEERLSRDFIFPISETVKKLIASSAHK